MSDAQIFDRGYRTFEGERSGLRGAVRSVVWHTTRSILGLGRSARHKVFPVAVIVIAFLPALAFLALAVLIGDLVGEVRPEYWEFFGFAFLATLVFTALVAPEALVRDRRDGMYSLYLSTPLSKVSYLASKVGAVLLVMSLVVLAPPLLWLLGYTFQNQGPDGFTEWIWVAFRLIVAGLAICVTYASVSLGVSSLTDRRAFASIAVVLFLLGLSIIAEVLAEVAELDQHIRLIDPLGTVFELSPRLFGDRGEGFQDVSTVAVAAATVGWIAFGVGLIVVRYRKLDAV